MEADEEIKLFEEWNGKIECFICKKTYIDFINFRVKYLSIIEQLLKKMEKNKQKIKEINGFTLDKNISIDNLNDKFLNIAIEEFKENKSSFIEEEQKLTILYNFIKKYNPIFKESGKIKDIIEIYKKQSENFKDIIEINTEIKGLLKYKDEIENHVFSFNKVKKNNIFKAIGDNNIFHLLMFKYLPEQLFSFEKEESIYLCPFCQEIFMTNGEDNY